MKWDDFCFASLLSTQHNIYILRLKRVDRSTETDHQETKRPRDQETKRPRDQESENERDQV